jgi:hypothetical protein
MADIDLPGQFPNSKMAGAVKQGQSRFVSVDVAGTLLRGVPENELPPPPETKNEPRKR